MKIYEFRWGFHWCLFQHWRRPGDAPLSEPVMVSLLMHICVIRPQWINAAATLYGGWLIIYLICSNHNLIYNSNFWNIDIFDGSIKSSRPSETYIGEIFIEIQYFWQIEMNVKMSLANWRQFCLGLDVLIMMTTILMVELPFTKQWFSYSMNSCWLFSSSLTTFSIYVTCCYCVSYSTNIRSNCTNKSNDSLGIQGKMYLL